ncbi:MAG: 2-phospho-L-lactate transferase [Dehalococcoidia bacterium]|nr:2-phospho-L-lactate transferase [Dehalococcoidia bacterium]
MNGPVLALAGGVGGAKLALGLSHVLPPRQLVIVANTGDDDVFHGLHVSPDLDTLMYTLAGLANPATGWGVVGDTFGVLDMLKRYGADSWFGLGDRDLATHIERTRLLREGRTLSEVTRYLCGKLGVKTALAPMSDDPVRTMVETDQGTLAFQDYFVKHRCEPSLRNVRFAGASKAQASPAFQNALNTAGAVVYCPSNPVVSIGPILALPGVMEHLKEFRGPMVAISPIVGDHALRGPAAKMLLELGEEVSCVGVARRLAGICDVLVVDRQDAHRVADVRAAGMDVEVMDTIMETDADKERLARELLQLVETLVES